MAVTTEQLSIQIKISSQDGEEQLKKFTVSLKGLDDAADKASEGLDGLEEKTDKLSSSTEDAKEKTDQFTKSTKDNKTSSDKLSDTYKDLATSAGGIGVQMAILNQALELGKKVFGAIAGPIQQVTEAFKVQEAAETGLANTLRITGEFSQQTLQEFLNFASGLQQVTTVGDEVSLGMIKIAKSMGLTNDQAKNLITASADLSAATGKGLEESFRQLLKTFGGAAGELAEMLPAVKNLTQEQLKSGKAVDLVAKQFTGFASAATKTMAGAAQQASNAFGDLQEEIGRTISEVFNLPGALQRNKQIFEDLIEIVKEVRPTLIAMREEFVAFADRVQTALSKIDFQGIIDNLQVLGPLLLMVFTPTLAPIIASIAASLTALVVPIVVVTAKIILIGGAIAVAVGALEILLRNLQNTDQVLDLFAGAFLVVFEGIKRGFLNLLSFILQKASDLVGQLGQAFPSLFGDIAVSAIEKATKGIVALEEQILKSEESSKLLTAQLKLTSEGLDLGATGKIVEGVASAIESFASSADDAAKSGTAIKDGLQGAEGAAAGLKDKTGAVAEDMKVIAERARLLKEIGEQNRQLELEIANIGVDRITQIKNAYEFQKQSLTLRMQELKAQGLLNEEMKKGFDQQLKLLGQRANAQIGAVEQDDLKKMQEEEKRKADAAKEQETSFMDSFLGAVSTGASMLADFAGSIFDPQQSFGLVEGILDGIEQLPERLMQVFDNLGDILTRFIAAFPRMVESFVRQFPGIIQKIVDAIPKFVEVLIDALPKIVQSLVDGLVQAIPALAQGLAQALPVIFTSLAKAIGPIVSAIIESLPTILEGLMNGIIEAIPELAQSLIQIIVQFFETLPDLIDVFISKLPAMIEALAEAIPQVAIALVEAFINLILGGGLEKIVGGILRAIPKIVVAFVRGIINGLAKGIGRLFGGGNTDFVENVGESLKLVGDKATEGVKQIAKAATGVGDQLFKVMDLEAEAKKLKNAKEIAEAVNSSTEKASKTFKSIFQKLKEVWDKIFGWFDRIFGGLISKAWEGIVKFFEGLGLIVSVAWKAIMTFFEGLGGIIAHAWKNIILFFEGFGQIVSMAWKTILDVLGALGSIVKDAWDTVINFFKLIFQGKVGEAFQGIIDFFGRTWATLVDGVWKPIVNFFKDAFGVIISNVWKPLIEFWKNVFSTIVDNVFKPIINFWKTVFNTIIDNVFEPIIKFWKELFVGIVKKVFDPITEALGLGKLSESVSKAFDGVLSFFDNFQEKINKGFDGVTNFFSNLGGNINNAFSGVANLFDGLGGKVDGAFSGVTKFFNNLGGTINNAFSGIWKTFANLEDVISFREIGKHFSRVFDALNPANLIDKLFPDVGNSQGWLERKLDFDVPVVSFAGGGLVPGVPIVPGDSELNDRVLALLSPGEVVIPRSVVMELEKMIGTLPRFGLGKAFKAAVKGDWETAREEAGGALKPPEGGVLGAIADGDWKAAAEQIDPRNFSFSEIQDKVIEQIVSGINDLITMGFNSGGLVPGSGNGDTVPAMLTPGEFVVNRGAVGALGVGALERINRGQMPGGMNVNQSVSVTINTTEKVDAAFIKNRVVPAIKEELKRDSLNGKFVLSKAGLR